MRRQIYRVENVENCYDIATGLAVAYLSYEEPTLEYGDKLISAGGEDATLEELAAFCDQSAESCNAHDFCGSHRLLGAVLYKSVGRQTATFLMLDIALMGGLHGMGGICSEGDAYEELGVGENGRDWHGNYGA